VREIRLEEDVDPDRPLRRPLGAARYRFYTPYWLNALVRPIFRPLVNRADRKAAPEPRAARRGTVGRLTGARGWPDAPRCAPEARPA
jgi:hypothetical protein